MKAVCKTTSKFSKQTLWKYVNTNDLSYVCSVTTADIIRRQKALLKGGHLLKTGNNWHDRQHSDI